MVPNATARIKRQLRLLVADETDTKIKDHSQLQYFRPVERGCVTDTAVQNVVWDRVFGQALLNVKTEDCTLLLTVPPFMPSSAQEALDDLVFDTYGFAAYARLTPQQMAIHAFHSNSVGKVAGAASSAANTASISAAASSGSSSTRRLAAVGDGPESWWATIAPSVSREQCGLAFSMSGTGVIIDSGFSFTHVVPFVNWAPVAGGIRRVDVGGKALTNMLKECLSYRQFNLMDDAWLVTRVKEALCYASVDFMAEMALARLVHAEAIYAGPAFVAVSANVGGTLAWLAEPLSSSSSSTASSQLFRIAHICMQEAISTWCNKSSDCKGESVGCC